MHAPQYCKRIAIVDDEESICSVFSILVRSLGYDAEFVAHDGNDIVRAVSQKTIQPDLVIMDYRMPVMNGMDAAEKILAMNPKIKIIIASADDSIREDAESIGLLFVQKPFGKAKLAEIISNVFSS